MYVKDTDEAYLFYNLWHKNYLISCEKGVYIDEPALSMTNVEQNDTIKKLKERGTARFALVRFILPLIKYCISAQRKNMPVSYLSNKNYLNKIKAEGVNTRNSRIYGAIGRINTTRYCNMCCRLASFAVSPMYETQRKHFLLIKTQGKACIAPY